MVFCSSSGPADVPLQNRKIVERLNQGSGVMIILIKLHNTSGIGTIF
jgi:hypothetical protein